MVTAILASRYSLKPVVIRSRAKGHNLGLPVMGDTWRVWGRAESPGQEGDGEIVVCCPGRRLADDGGTTQHSASSSMAASG